MNKLGIQPDENSFDLTPASGVITTPLDGGAPRSRVDIVGGWAKATVQWTTGPAGYAYLMQAARYSDENGGYHFAIDLPFYFATLTECEAMFVPESFKLVSKTGLTYVCSATLYVKPPPMPAATWPVLTDFQEGIITTDDGEPINI